jgi:hypothetical protein
MKVTFTEYNDIMNEFMETSDFKSLPLLEQFELLLKKAEKYEIYDKKKLSKEPKKHFQRMLKNKPQKK